jgi:hypothetical protein
VPLGEVGSVVPEIPFQTLIASSKRNSSRKWLPSSETFGEHIQACSGLSFGAFDKDCVDGLAVVVLKGSGLLIDLSVLLKEDFVRRSLETFHFFLFFLAEIESVTYILFSFVRQQSFPI